MLSNSLLISDMPTIQVTLIKSVGLRGGQTGSDGPVAIGAKRQIWATIEANTRKAVQKIVPEP